MNKYYSINVTLTLKGPLMTSGGGDAVRGLNRIFYRNADGDFVLQGSHVKGKLREALKEIRPDFDIDEWFGVKTRNNENEQGNYLPKRGKLKFEDFILHNSSNLKLDRRLTRVSIDTQTGTSKENFLQNMEALFPSGSESVWRGKVGFFAEDDQKAKDLMEELIKGLKWITALGGIKGSGYGRLQKVNASLETCTNLPVSQPLKPADHEITLILEFLDDLQIGGIAKGTNYRETEMVIPGGVIKGSLARFLNELCGERELTRSIDGNNKAVAQSFNILAKHFSKLHISHAFPAPPLADRRPVVRPFSTVEVGDEPKEYFDVALCEKPELYHDEQAPLFQVDWKKPEALKKEFGWANCETIHKTRTAINPQTRTADENKLFTFQYVTPFSSDHDPASSGVPARSRSKIRWIARIRFPIIEPNESETMISQFEQAVHAGWQYMGKRNARFTVEMKNGPVSTSMQKCKDGLISDKLAIITLQTDALLFDGRRLVAEDIVKQDDYLRKAYEAYWQQVFGESCTLLRFFARQKLAGGYLVKRFNSEPDQKYYPYVLTEAGSVFVLSATDAKTTKEILEKLEKQGLPLPDDITAEIKKKGKEPWQACPFVPENGYGEITVNLSWHWEKSLKDNS